MRQPVRNNPAKRPLALTQQLPAPVKGWTAKGTPVDADPMTALVLDNWWPEAESVGSRYGYESFAAGLSSVETLMTYTSATASKLFGCGGGSIYDITLGGSVGTADVSGLSGDEWQWVNFATSGGQFLVAANGEDSVRNYDGSSWSTPTITNVTSSTLVYPTIHKSRLWFAQINTADLWYLPVSSIAGAATKFPIGSLLKRGGYVMAVGTWSVDAGDGMDDLFAAYSSEGEVVVYAGTDPGDANAWALKGVYRIGKPIGRRCMEQMGGDLALLTEDGIISLSQVMALDRAIIGKNALTANIRDAFSTAVRASREIFGWQMVVHYLRNMAILNVPGTGASNTVQFAINTVTGAWTRFTGMRARCWGTYNNRLFFGASNGVVYEADKGATDDGRDIELVMLPAYNHLSMRGRLKHVKLVQPIYESSIIDEAPAVFVAVDYGTPDEGSATPSIGTGYFTWGTSVWGGPDIWFAASVTSAWRGNGGLGKVVSPYTTATLNDPDIAATFTFKITGWTVVYEVGGFI